MIWGKEMGDEHACKDMDENGVREHALFLDIGCTLNELYTVDELRGEVKSRLKLIQFVVGE